MHSKLIFGPPCFVRAFKSIICKQFSIFCLLNFQIDKTSLSKIHMFLLSLLFCFFQGQQDLQEVVEKWAQTGHIMSKFFKESYEERPKDFMSKFLTGAD